MTAKWREHQARGALRWRNMARIAPRAVSAAIAKALKICWLHHRASRARAHIDIFAPLYRAAQWRARQRKAICARYFCAARALIGAPLRTLCAHGGAMARNMHA